MTQKELIEQMLESEKGYDEIEDKTGSTRSYIRSIAVGYRKRSGEGEKTETQEREPETQPKTTPEAGMNFIDDITPPKIKTGSRTGADHHKEWVKAAKYECGFCGATIGKSTSFCPHCGKPMVWEGIE